MLTFIKILYVSKLSLFTQINYVSTSKPCVNLFQYSNNLFGDIDPRKIDPNISIQIKNFQNDQITQLTNKSDKAEYYLFKDTINLLLKEVSVKKLKFEEFYLNVSEMVFVDDHSTLKKVFKWCGHKCKRCKGRCILNKHHKCDHSFYHLPVFEDDSVSFSCFGKAQSIQEFSNDTFISGSSLFWKYMLLKYSSSISRFLGRSAPLIDLKKLSSSDIKVLSLTEDEVIEMI